jgi:2-polyprenyl-3-methyl-5-hydroxy-6-metoxy-1,4-benzoquinol methylase
MHEGNVNPSADEAPQMRSSQLPAELSYRIAKEQQENDEIYRRRSLDSLDISKTHYGHRRMLEWALRQLPNLNGARVLDVGVGEGQSSVLLASAGARVTGIDVSGEALMRAAELARRCGVEAEFIRMPGEDLRFPEKSFDAILCMSVYHHMNLERAILEFVRVLRPGGRVVMIEPLATNPPAWLYRRFGRLFSREATSEETPLKVDDLNVLRKHFRLVQWQGMFLLSVGLFGLDRIFHNSNRIMHWITKSAFNWIYPLDLLLLKIPGLQRMAWKMAIVAEL